MAKKIEMPKKAEKQFQELRAKFKVTRREFLEYYNSVRKANKKVKSTSFRKKSLRTPSFTLNVGHIKTRKYFIQQKQRFKTILNRDYLTISNKKQRQQLYDNLRKVLGNKNANKIKTILDQLTDEQLKKFFADNEDLEKMMYDSEPDIAQFIDITVDDILSRF